MVINYDHNYSALIHGYLPSHRFINVANSEPFYKSTFQVIICRCLCTRPHQSPLDDVFWQLHIINCVSLTVADRNSKGTWQRSDCSTGPNTSHWIRDHMTSESNNGSLQCWRWHTEKFTVIRSGQVFLLCLKSSTRSLGKKRV